MRYIYATVTMMMGQDRGQASQRIKVGMIGLAAIILLIGLAAVISSTISHDKPVVVAGGARPDVVANLVGQNQNAPASSATSEPVTELGVAPSAPADANAAGSAKPGQHQR